MIQASKSGHRKDPLIGEHNLEIGFANFARARMRSKLKTKREENFEKVISRYSSFNPLSDIFRCKDVFKQIRK